MADVERGVGVGQGGGDEQLAGHNRAFFMESGYFTSG
jgi:hypothetical protein